MHASLPVVWRNLHNHLHSGGNDADRDGARGILGDTGAMMNRQLCQRMRHDLPPAGLWLLQ